MYMMMLSWLSLELSNLVNLYNSEIMNYLKKFDIKEYSKNLFFSKNKKLMFKMISILFLIFIFKFFWDVFKVMFSFYYMTMNWIISILKFFVKFYTNNELVLMFVSKLFDFIKYFVLFLPLVKMSEKLKKRKMRLYVYLIESTMDYIMRMISWRPRMSSRLSYLVPMLAFLFIYICWMPAETAKFMALLFMDYLVYIEVQITRWNMFFKMIYNVHQYNKKVSNMHLRDGASLFQMASLLQKQGYMAPECETKVSLSALSDYSSYCSSYKQSEMAPDYLDRKGIDMYVSLLDLFSDTSYELKPVPIMEFVLIMYPYQIYYKFFFFFIIFL